MQEGWCGGLGYFSQHLLEADGFFGVGFTHRLDAGLPL